MTTMTSSRTFRPVVVPLQELIPWSIFFGFLMFIMLYFVGIEQGATSIFPGIYIHELVHDGRHLIGFPCH